jgi:molybdopterin synthase sulfur carrier subunit
MPLKLVFLGRLEDVAGGPEREVPTVASVEQVLAALDGELAAALKVDRVKLAVNGMLFHDPAAPVLKDGDEIAFLPPVSGG